MAENRCENLSPGERKLEDRLNEKPQVHVVPRYERVLRLLEKPLYGLFLLVVLLFSYMLYNDWAVHYPSVEFWHNVASGSISATIALIVGIPVALLIDRWVKKIGSVGKLKELVEQEKRILQMVESELLQNLSLIEKRKARKGVLNTAPLKVAEWKSISLSGEVGCIRDKELLRTIAFAYYTLEELIAREQRVVDIYFSADRDFAFDRVAIEKGTEKEVEVKLINDAVFYAEGLHEPAWTFCRQAIMLIYKAWGKEDEVHTYKKLFGGARQKLKVAD